MINWKLEDEEVVGCVCDMKGRVNSLFVQERTMGVRWRGEQLVSAH